MKFDVVLMNPPFNRALHLDFFNKCLDISNKVVCVEPGQWLVQLKFNGKYTKSDSLSEQIKQKIERHVESVELNNLNKVFDIANKTVCSITYVDFTKDYSNIDFECCGEHSTVKSLYDCNLIGERKIVNSILQKCAAFEISMGSKNTKSQSQLENVKYLKIDEIVVTPLGKYGSSAEKMLDLPCFIGETSFGKFALTYIAPSFSQVDSKIYDSIPFAKKRGASKELSDHAASCVYGTLIELENWKHFTTCNKLPLFLNIVLTINQNNNSKEFLPWLVNKQYTDEEINKLFGFTDEEIALIDHTIKKYERNSPWFKRYMCGFESSSNEEIQKFINEINA